MKLHIANRKLARFGRPILYVVIASMLLPLLFSTTAPPVAADPGWWDNNWMCRRSITIIGNHPEDCQVRIVIPYDSDMQVDYDDLRFLENETASELSYWIESYTANSATVWVRRLENTDSTIYVYYGNPSAASASNATNTFIFFDDFNDGSLGSWTFSEIGGAKGSWTESGTVIRLTGTDTGDMWNDADKILFLSISGNYDNVLAESYTPAWYGSHGDWSKMGGVQLRQNLDANSKNRIMSPVYSSAGATNSYRLTTGASTTEATTDTRPKYNRVSRVGGTSRAWYSTDGITWTELGSEISFTGGLADSVHLGTHLAGLSTTEHWVEIDWFRVRKYVSPEPSANVGTEETIAAPPPAFDFSVSASPDNLSVQQTGSVSTTVSVTLTSGTAGTVSLTGSWIGTAPGGVTPSFTPPSGTPNFGSTLTFSTTAAASVGTFTYRVMGTGGGQTHSDDVTLNITGLFPVAPSLVSPNNRITIDSLTPTFDWADAARATSYTLEVATDNNFSNIVCTKTAIESTATLSETEKLSYGTHYYWRVRGTNAAGLGDWSSTWSFTAKLTAPNVMTFEIAAGATYTSSTTVQLTITAQNAVEISFSSDGVVWGKWEPYQTSKSYTLEAPDGPKNIYIRVRDNIKDVSQTSVASITLDQTPPSTQKDLSGDLRAEGYKGSVVVTLTSMDTTSGVGSTRYRVDGGEWKTGTTFVISSEGKHTIEYYSTDAAGNEEEIKSLQVTVYTPTILPPILTQYWWAFLSIIVVAVVVASLRLKGPSPKKRLKMVLEGKKEVLRLKKEAAVKYYKNGSIARGTYDELMRKYDDRMAELEEKERALRARMKKKVKKKVKKRRGLKRK